MPHSLQAQFTLFSLEELEKKHQRCDFQFGGIYCISTNESRYWRPKYGHCPIAFKVGKTWDCLSRLNQYLTYSPFSRGGGVRLHCFVIMDHRTNDQKLAISQAESFVLSKLRKKYPDRKSVVRERVFVCV